MSFSIYRFISHIAKILEKVIYKLLIIYSTYLYIYIYIYIYLIDIYIYKFNLLDNKQNGYEQGHSTDLVLPQLLTIFTHHLTMKKPK